MQNHLLGIAISVIAKADREHLADAVLRAELRKQRHLSPDSSREISRAVFAYYRWFGWLDRGEPVSKQILQAIQLAARFNQNPASFTDEELLAKALPSWLANYVTLSADCVRALQSEPKVWLRTRPGLGASVAAKLGDCRIAGDEPLRDCLCYEGSKDLFRTREFQAGEFELQDISSQTVGWICNPQPGEKWWDACAGEGGKTLHLADLMQNTGSIWASDRAEWRLKKLKFRAARAKLFNYRTALWNGGAKLPTQTKFDGVLIDAPCSGIGTWQRNPQARWTTTRADVEELGALQEQLLRHAIPALKPEARLVYAVCTLTRRETTDVAVALARRCPNLKPLATTNPLHTSAPAAPQHWIWPGLNGGNGMFVASWQSAQV